MLGSITPLGERGKGVRWGWTVFEFSLAAVAGGALIGYILGALGRGASTVGLLPENGWRWALAVPLLVIGGIAEWSAIPLPLPTMHRQVNDNWLRHYRRWVYATGFGFQLGAAVLTVMNSVAVHCFLLLIFLVASPQAGIVGGGVYGLVRGLSLLLAHDVQTPAGLSRVERRLRRLERGSRLGSGFVLVTAGSALVLMIY